MSRSFTDKPATREATPLLVGLFGPSGGGKTKSGLRIATGIQRVVGGEIWGIDSENKRMLHYADDHRFRYVEFKAPYSPKDYTDATQYCLDHGAKVILVDSASHEHEGKGGVLEWHSEEMKRLAQKWGCSEEKAQPSAWIEPKKARRDFIELVTHCDANFVMCFRAREKLNFKSRNPQELGWMPIGAEELFFEMTVTALLTPESKGIPQWKPARSGESLMVKLPGQFEAMFAESRQLDEDIGQKLAEWANGSPGIDLSALVKRYQNAADAAELAMIETIRQEAWPRLNATQKRSLKSASDEATKRLSPPKSGPEVFG
jgi:hypothetical protein